MTLEELRKIHTRAFAALVEYAKQLPRMKTGALIRTGYEYQEMEKLHDDLRKETKKFNVGLQKILSIRWLVADGPPEVQADDISAMPKPKIVPTLPPTRSEDYIALGVSLGVPAELLESDLVRINWPAFADHYDRLVAEGKPMPPGCYPHKESTQYKVHFKKRKVPNE